MGHRFGIRMQSSGWVLGAVLVLNFLLVLFFFRHTLTIIPNTGDENSVLFQARIFKSLRLAAPAPPHAEIMVSDYITVKDGRWFSIYPPGYPLLLSLGVWLGGAHLAVALMSCGILFLVFRLVLRVYRDPVLAWLVLALLFVSPAFRFHSSSYYTHIGTLLVIVLGLNVLLAGPGPGRKGATAAVLAALAAVGMGIRPMTTFLAFLPISVYLALPPDRSRGGASRDLRYPAVLLGAAAVALLLTNMIQSGSLGESVYLRLVNSGGRLSIMRNLCWEGAQRLFSMTADTAKWLFAFGWFVNGDLKEASPGDWNFSTPLLLGGVLFGLHEAARVRELRRPHALLLGIAAALVLGHLFYDKQGGRFGERRFFEAGFIFCLFFARLLLAGLRLLSMRFAGVVLLSLFGPVLAVLLPGTMARLRDCNEERFEPYFILERRGIRDGLVFLEDTPTADFTPRFYARNSPDLSGNIFVVSGPWNPEVEELFPGRRTYRFFYDWKRLSPALEAYRPRGG
jgi:hypothetical protein